MKYLLAAFIICSAFAPPKTNSIKPFLWLVGNWKQDGKETFEKWQVVNDTMLGGVGYHFIVEKGEEDEEDIIFDESIRLVSRGRKFYYLPTPRKETDGIEVEFKIVSFTKNSFV